MALYNGATGVGSADGAAQVVRGVATGRAAMVNEIERALTSDAREFCCMCAPFLSCSSSARGDAVRIGVL